MLRTFIDHLIVTAPTLQVGNDDISSNLGIRLEGGGRHSKMGTHNRLARLGNERYLEVIAIDPMAPPPARPRWFDLDRITGRKTTQLAGWVARTNDIQEVVSRIGSRLGLIEMMSRGPLEWLITIPADGGTPFDGVGPMLIQWQRGPHPSERLDDQNCELVKLEGFHPRADEISELLDSIGFHDEIVVSKPRPDTTPCLVAHLRTPNGIYQLQSMGAIRG